MNDNGFDNELELLLKNFLKSTLKYYYDFQDHSVERKRFRMNSLSFNILFRLHTTKERKLTIMELADRMQISKPQLVKLLNNLEDEKLVIRERFKENRRIVYLSLSEKGNAYIAQALENMEEALLQRLLKQRDIPMEELADAVRKITAAMDTP